MIGPARIRVRYPARLDDRLVLRTSLDWDHDLPPIAIDDERTTWVPAAPGLLQGLPGPRRAARVGGRAEPGRADRGALGVPAVRRRENGTITEPLQLGGRTVRVYRPPG
jgi:hypothetical protein